VTLQQRGSASGFLSLLACLERFTAPVPAGVTPEKYDATCDVSLAIAKYGASLPWYRLARMQESFGVPMPESVQSVRFEADSQLGAAGMMIRPPAMQSRSVAGRRLPAAFSGLKGAPVV